MGWEVGWDDDLPVSTACCAACGCPVMWDHPSGCPSCGHVDGDPVPWPVELACDLLQGGITTAAEGMGRAALGRDSLVGCTTRSWTPP